MRLRFLGFPVVLSLLVCSVAQAATYYVSSAGSDNNAGTSTSAPWKTSAKVNGISFAAGDRILFASGQSFSGGLTFGATDKGTASNPITVSSYGTGRAIINAGAAAGFYAYNCSGIVVSNINFAGSGSTANTKDGVSFYADLANNAVLDGITVSQVDVSGFGGSGILFGTWSGSTHFSNVTIYGCSSHDNLKAGISSYAQNSYVHTNIYIGYCQVYNNFGDPAATGNTGNGIVLGEVSGAVVEYCAAHDNGKNNFVQGEGPVGIWCYDAQFVTLQFNESHHNHTSGAHDGGGLDLDIDTKNSIIQYNYSHDNDGAGYLLCCDGNNSGNVIRYNISQNDARKNGFGGIHTYGAITNASIFNNTVYMANTTPSPAALVLSTGMVNSRIQNNIFQTAGGAQLAWIASGQSGLSLQGNDYWPGAGAFAIVDSSKSYSGFASWQTATGREKLGSANVGLNVDPRLVSAGGGALLNDATLLPNLAAYKLQTNSPMLDAGLNLPKLVGINAGTRDFYGVPIAQGTGFDVGACEAPCDVMIEGAGWSSAGFQVLAMGTINKTNVLEASSDMIHWVALTNTTSGTVQVTDTNSAKMPLRFYRIRQ
ncbi:MAG: parallel beta-helix repeat-containing protein [Verrucomicrobiales bacterium]|nr:parallel beta-helix repeat-containing protein [Verrucomicrobiales bacterium]